MSPATFRIYKKTWFDFIEKYQISPSKRPVEEDFMGFLEDRHNNGHGFNSLKSYYSHLNKAMKCLYRFDLEKWPMIFGFVKATSKGYVVKKAPAFEKSDLDQFFNEIQGQLSNRYILARGTVAAISFFGGNRMHELKSNMKWKGKFLN